MAKNARYSQRLPARILDLSLAGLVVLAAEKINPCPDIGLLIAFYLYNITTVLCGGTTLGKHAFSLKIKSSEKGLNRLLILSARETMLFILFPFLVLNFIFISAPPLHDRILGSTVVKDER